MAAKKSKSKKTKTKKDSCYYAAKRAHKVFPSAYEAIQCEKYIKGKTRKWKEELIKQTNPDWKFLNEIVLGEWPPNKTLAF